MRLVLGGRYQGKLDYVLQTYGLKAEDVFTCTDMNVAFEAPCIYRTEEFVFACVKAGIHAAEVLEANKAALQNAIVICDDISGGVVPIDKDERAWREENGWALAWLSRNAESVERLFCGIPQRLK